jgi:hypothetical protein
MWNFERTENVSRRRARPCTKRTTPCVCYLGGKGESNPRSKLGARMRISGTVRTLALRLQPTYSPFYTTVIPSLLYIIVKPCDRINSTARPVTTNKNRVVARSVRLFQHLFVRIDSRVDSCSRDRPDPEFLRSRCVASREATPRTLKNGRGSGKYLSCSDV